MQVTEIRHKGSPIFYKFAEFELVASREIYDEKKLVAWLILNG